MKPLFLLPFVLLVAGSSAQDLSKPVTYRTVAVPIHQALAEISKQSGVRLYASAELDDEPIILSLKGATTDEVMKRIAEAVGAEWVKRDKNEFLLHRTTELEKKLSQEALQAKAAEVQKALDRIKAPEPLTGEALRAYGLTAAKSLGGMVKLNREKKLTDDVVDGVVGQLPAQRAMRRLIKLIPAKQIAAVEEGETIALSNHPNRMQAALPRGADEIGEQLRTEQNAVAEAFSGLQVGSLDLFEGRLKKSVQPLENPPARLLVLLRRDEVLWARLVVVDDSGRPMGFAEEFLTVDPLLSSRRKHEATLAASVKEKEIPLSVESEAVSAVLKETLHRSGDVPPLKSPARELLLDPVTHDPLSFLVSDAFLAWADENGANLVVYPPDEWVSYGFLRAEENVFKLSRWIETIDESGARITEDGGWLVVAPNDKIEAWHTRTNREIFKKCLDEAEDQGFISVRTAAELAETDRTLQEPPLASMIGLLNRKYAPYLDREKFVLRFYASLSPSQLGILAQGSALPTASMSKDQWTLFEDVAFRASPRVSFAGAQGSEPAAYALASEPTEVMPDGVPEDASVTMQWQDMGLYYVGLRSDTSTFTTAATLEFIGKLIAERQLNTPGSQEIVWIAPGHARMATLSFNVGNGRKRVGRLGEMLRSNERWTLDQVPADLKEKLDAAVIQARKELDKQPGHEPTEPPSKPPLRY